MIVLLLLIASAKASQGAKTEAPKAPTSQPPGLTALVADAVAREGNVRDRAVAFDRLCQSLAGGKDRSTKCTHLFSHPALQPSSPMRLPARSRFVIVLLLLIASAKASQGAKTEAPKAPTSQPPGLTALDADAVALGQGS